MSRYTGPRVKIIRRFGQQLPGLTRKSLDRRPYAPGQHGPQRRRKASDYRTRLDEKQKLRMNYGVQEAQFRRYITKASRSKGDTGVRLLQLLEGRFDNVVFRAGFAPTIPAARQLVTHGHMRINGKKVNIPSYQLRPGDVITLRERSKKIDWIVECTKSPVLVRPSYLEVDAEQLTATFKALPAQEDVPLQIQVNLIIEYYSQRI
ncbi:MAG: 30S ribosomal protein S4 [Myxococcota bacterium]|jgi:small subunit ribosomal protein S4|nr:30S ribosomal protein S4 [Myxococcota bacterium]